MINLEKLAPILKAYKADFLNNWKGEEYKWKAVKWFQDNWNINAENFGEMFKNATKKHYNLLATSWSYPRGMIIDFAAADDEATREMFRALFNEATKIDERIEAFQKASDSLFEKYSNGKWKQHFQSPSAISTYLWLGIPNKYYIYKYEYSRSLAQELNPDSVPEKGGGAKSVLAAYQLYDEIRSILKNDNDIKQLIQQALTPDCYEDSELVTAISPHATTNGNHLITPQA